VRLTSALQLQQWVAAERDQQRGEIVLVVEGKHLTHETLDPLTQRWLRALAVEMAPARAAAIAARVTGLRKRLLYDWLTADNATEALAPPASKQ
jgi:16S rRNA (cytidine1402-2'-O)-methyltransferase